VHPFYQRHSLITQALTEMGCWYQFILLPSPHTPFLRLQFFKLIPLALRLSAAEVLFCTWRPCFRSPLRDYQSQHHNQGLCQRMLVTVDIEEAMALFPLVPMSSHCSNSSLLGAFTILFPINAGYIRTSLPSTINQTNIHRVTVYQVYRATNDQVTTHKFSIHHTTSQSLQDVSTLKLQVSRESLPSLHPTPLSLCTFISSLATPSPIFKFQPLCTKLTVERLIPYKYSAVASTTPSLLSPATASSAQHFSQRRRILSLDRVLYIRRKRRRR